MMPVAKREIDEAKEAGEDPRICFFTAAPDDDVIDSLTGFLSLGSKMPQLVIVDINDQTVYVCNDANVVTEEKVKAFVADFHDGKLTGRKTQRLSQGERKKNCVDTRVVVCISGVLILHHTPSTNVCRVGGGDAFFFVDSCDGSLRVMLKERFVSSAERLYAPKPGTKLGFSLKRVSLVTMSPLLQSVPVALCLCLS